MTGGAPEASGLAGIAVTGWSLHLPGVDLAAAVPLLAAVAPEVAERPACPAEAAHELLGRKGLLGKDPATRLALCAVHRALGLPARTPREQGPPDPDVAVVASSNFGNVSTVVDVVRSVRRSGRSGVSPLAAPNASSNSLASGVAIWFRFGGPNLLVCSGATAGLDAVALGALLLRAGRARRVVVVGAEPADEVAAALQETRAAPPGPLRAGAACVVLEPAMAGHPLVRSTLGEPPVDPGGAASPALVRSTLRQPPVDPRGAVPALSRSTLGEPPLDLRDAALVIGPAGTAAPGAPRIDLAASCGDLYGALGVVQIAVAAAIAGAGTRPGRVRVVSGDAADGWRTVDVLPPAGGLPPAAAAGRVTPLWTAPDRTGRPGRSTSG